ncbi:16S rRNA (uracil(1498)-N(3))-methyltransferase [Porticoccus sp. W117]|uniref:16S rRNA (uracil(1498)-N(3))-methyltransferase n=1 Tax=Porticoccus sp. W117 TaxID=3054777 RepID=UPI00259AD656|nr:16S rRNA (uracil(1498)-N(3))-methyltransferase [Porticoccus sp. W117]MDM3870193.1 16S rRNA (uracil(1498)-N(3))-methyltransferase [Porticoccus sp. W117]
MNLLLIEQEDLTDADRAVISGRRLQHMLEVHRVNAGDTLKAGLIGGNMGTATILSLSSQQAELQLHLDQPPPPPLPTTLILALPRPKMLRRVLQTVAAMGVKQLYLFNSYRVEKSFWQSPFLQADAIREQLILGLEQARDTTLPQVHLRQRFKPFVEDELPAIAENTKALVAHPKNATPCPIDVSEATTLAVGPEGGFIDYEVDKLVKCGFEAVSLGPRILRVETAVPVILSRVYPG